MMSSKDDVHKWPLSFQMQDVNLLWSSVCPPPWSVSQCLRHHQMLMALSFGHQRNQSPLNTLVIGSVATNTRKYAIPVLTQLDIHTIYQYAVATPSLTHIRFELCYISDYILHLIATMLFSPHQSQAETDADRGLQHRLFLPPEAHAATHLQSLTLHHVVLTLPQCVNQHQLSLYTDSYVSTIKDKLNQHSSYYSQPGSTHTQPAAAGPDPGSNSMLFDEVLKKSTYIPPNPSGLSTTTSNDSSQISAAELTFDFTPLYLRSVPQAQSTMAQPPDASLAALSPSVDSSTPHTSCLSFSSSSCSSHSSVVSGPSSSSVSTTVRFSGPNALPSVCLFSHFLSSPQLKALHLVGCSACTIDDMVHNPISTASAKAFYRAHAARQFSTGDISSRSVLDHYSVWLEYSLYHFVMNADDTFHCTTLEIDPHVYRTTGIYSLFCDESIPLRPPRAIFCLPRLGDALVTNRHLVKLLLGKMAGDMIMLHNICQTLLHHGHPTLTHLQINISQPCNKDDLRQFASDGDVSYDEEKSRPISTTDDDDDSTGRAFKRAATSRGRYVATCIDDYRAVARVLLSDSGHLSLHTVDLYTGDIHLYQLIHLYGIVGRAALAAASCSSSVSGSTSRSLDVRVTFHANCGGEHDYSHIGCHALCMVWRSYGLDGFGEAYSTIPIHYLKVVYDHRHEADSLVYRYQPSLSTSRPSWLLQLKRYASWPIHFLTSFLADPEPIMYATSSSSSFACQQLSPITIDITRPCDVQSRSCTSSTLLASFSHPLNQLHILRLRRADLMVGDPHMRAWSVLQSIFEHKCCQLRELDISAPLTNIDLAGMTKAIKYSRSLTTFKLELDTKCLPDDQYRYYEISDLANVLQPNSTLTSLSLKNVLITNFFDQEQEEKDGDDDEPHEEATEAEEREGQELGGTDADKNINDKTRYLNEHLQMMKDMPIKYKGRTRAYKPLLAIMCHSMPLIRLSLYNCPILFAIETPASFQRFTSCLASKSTLSHINLFKSGISNSQLHSLLSTLIAADHTSLTHLELSLEPNLTVDECLPILCEYITFNTNLHTVAIPVPGAQQMVIERLLGVHSQLPNNSNHQSHAVAVSGRVDHQLLQRYRYPAFNRLILEGFGERVPDSLHPSLLLWSVQSRLALVHTLATVLLPCVECHPALYAIILEYAGFPYDEGLEQKVVKEPSMF